ncbi:MAG: hypothetical protein HZA04_01165 [Nitrospinae bacterium]|nr:hypothetical protein [Nitrospinota bacterium]
MDNQNPNAERHEGIAGREPSTPAGVSSVPFSPNLEQVIEELDRVKRVMLHHERLATLGQMTACIAHEIRNPVNIISTSLQLLMMEGKIPAETKDEFRTIFNELTRIGNMVNSLTDFARDKKAGIRNVDAVEALKRTLNLLKFQLRLEKIEATLTAPDAPVWVKVDPDRITQVFLNILCNARDALNLIREKKICGILKYAGWKPAIMITAAATRDRCATISISDNGIGIPNDLRHKIFTPFFTTKDNGSGTGVGLSIAKGIISDYGGTLELDPNNTEGAIFVIKLPLAESRQP